MRLTHAYNCICCAKSFKAQSSVQRHWYCSKMNSKTWFIILCWVVSAQGHSEITFHLVDAFRWMYWLNTFSKRNSTWELTVSPLSPSAFALEGCLSEKSNLNLWFLCIFSVFLWAAENEMRGYNTVCNRSQDYRQEIKENMTNSWIRWKDC